MPPVVWVTAEGQGKAIGEMNTAGKALTRVDLFKPAPTDPAVRRADLLGYFLRSGLWQLIGQTVFTVKPVVRFAPLEAFDSLLSGFQNGLFEDAARQAGARDVTFD